MAVSRSDLDEKGAGSPEGLVARILKLELNLPIPVPIEKLCEQLDIKEIKSHSSDSFEGCLITDTDRSAGVILFNEASSKERRRFTIAHELGHFLIPSHFPDAAGRFLCSREDMLLQSAKENDRRRRMEVEANRFASLILIPPPVLRVELRNCRAPNLEHIPRLARHFEVSKEALSRAYAEHHNELVAIVVVRDGQVLRSYRNRVSFPFIQPTNGNRVPSGSMYHRNTLVQNTASDFVECVPDNWIDVKRGERAPMLYEQVYPQRDGFALILLHLVKPDEDEAEEERSLERSWEPQFRR